VIPKTDIIASRKKQYLKGLSILAILFLIAYLYLKFLSLNDWSHLPLHFFAIFSTTCLLLYLERKAAQLFKPKPQIFDYLSITKKSFKILGISLFRIHKDPKAYTKFITYLFDDHNPKIDLKFLLMNPDSPNLKQRQIEEDGPESISLDEEGKEIFRLKTECLETIKKLTNIQKFLKDKSINQNFNFYTYNMMPKHSMIIIDDDYVNVGPYLFKKRGIQTDSIEIDDEKSKKEYIEEFDSIWNQEEKANVKKK